jgi:hypothetical protein
MLGALALPSPAGSPAEAPGALAPPAPWHHALPLPWADAHSPALSAQVRRDPRQARAVRRRGRSG